MIKIKQTKKSKKFIYTTFIPEIIWRFWLYSVEKKIHKIGEFFNWSKQL